MIPHFPTFDCAAFPVRIDAIPGLKVRLRPIREAHNGNYLYTPHFAVYQSLPLLVSFILKKALCLTVYNENEILARIVDIDARSVLGDTERVRNGRSR